MLTRKNTSRYHTKTLFNIFLILIFFIQGLSIYLSAPYYFNYQNIFLPHKYILTDSWSYGIFEATQYLNSLPNAKDLTIWSDRKAACYYFVGTCIRRRKIDTINFMPNYYIITRRGEQRYHFKWLNNDQSPYNVDSVYSPTVLNNPVWEYDILNRPKNYIKIIDAQNITNN